MSEILGQWKLIVAVVGVLAGIGWVAERDSRLRAEGRAQVAEAAVEALTDSLEAAAVAVAVVEARADSVREAAEFAAAQSEKLISDLRTSRPRTVERVIREAGPDSTVVREAVAVVSASYESEIAVLRASLVQANAVIASQADLITAQDRQADVSAALIANLRTQVEAITSTKPGFLSRNTGRAMLVGATVAAVLITQEARR